MTPALAALFRPLRLAMLLLLAATASAAHAVSWPQEIDAAEGTIVVYQPQPETLKGNVLTGRAAMALQVKNRKDPIFGAFWFTARVDTDRAAGTARVRDLKVTQVRWPDSKDADEQRFTKAVEAAMPTAGFDISLARLTASLATAEREQQSVEALKNDPPKMVFSNALAVLLTFDGAPRFAAVENSRFERALNTPFLVVRDKDGKKAWLSSGSLWYEAADALGPWTPTQSPPADLVKMLPPADASSPAPKTPPRIVVASEPTELIVSDGAPRWKSLPGGKLLYVENTETAWVRELASGSMYVLLSGRWFRAKAEAGPWTFVRADQLPAAFKEIPAGSDIGGVRVSVAGTPEAEEAILDAQIPQTAAIKRSEAKLDVHYDSTPRFEPISGTSVSYAVNTGSQVLKIAERYYAVDNGVWFTAAAPTGPWAVADSIPQDEIKKIPPSSPVHNTTYVTIYDSTPEVVYVGYTPGYMWSFPYYGVPVYGSGWYYPPYGGPFYYPRPPTWGFNIGYNPWTGWTFGLSWSVGFMNVGVSWGGGWGGGYRPGGCCGGWYGGGWNRPPVIINTGNINIGNSVNIGNRTNIGNKIGKDNKINLSQSNHNIYQRPEARNRMAEPALVKKDMTQARASRDKQNNVFADKNGNVARRNGDQWEVRDNGKWSPESGGKDNRPAAAARPAEQRPALPKADDRPAVAKAESRPELPKADSRPTPAAATARPAPAAPAARPAAAPARIDRGDLDRANSARQTAQTRERAAAPRPAAGAARGGGGLHR